MALFILDTDHVTLFQRGHPPVHDRVLALPFGSVATTIVTAGGRLKAVRRASGDPSIIAAYDRLLATLEFFRNLPVRGFDAPAQERFTGLRQQKIRIGTHDLRIAGIALATDGVLVTGNVRDFSQVPGLKLEDWSMR